MQTLLATHKKDYAVTAGNIIACTNYLSFHLSYK